MQNKQLKLPPIRWYTITENIDIETGEILKEINKKKYIIIEKDIQYEINENRNRKQGFRKITNYVKSSGQLELF